MKGWKNMSRSIFGDEVTQDSCARARAHEGQARTQKTAQTRSRASREKTPHAESLRHSTGNQSNNSADLNGDSEGDSGVTQGDSQYESQVHRRIVNGLIRAGFWPETLVQGAGFPPHRKRMVWFGKTRGAPDIDVIGENLHIEVKKPSEKPQPHQRAYHARARRFGAVVLVADDADDAVLATEGLRELRTLLRWMERWLT